MEDFMFERYRIIPCEKKQLTGLKRWLKPQGIWLLVEELFTVDLQKLASQKETHIADSSP